MKKNLVLAVGVKKSNSKLYTSIDMPITSHYQPLPPITSSTTSCAHFSLNIYYLPYFPHCLIHICPADSHSCVVLPAMLFIKYMYLLLLFLLLLLPTMLLYCCHFGAIVKQKSIKQKLNQNEKWGGKWAHAVSKGQLRGRVLHVTARQAACHLDCYLQSGCQVCASTEENWKNQMKWQLL